MPRAQAKDTSRHVAAILKETGEADAKAAVRKKARSVIDLFQKKFGPVAPPFDLEMLASIRGIAMSDEAPTHSVDAELVPTGKGRVAIRVNRNRPLTRQRFSIGHEIVHTFFPGFETKVQCRPDHRFRVRSDPADLETLCDVGASEFLFPFPWFLEDAREQKLQSEAVVSLARKYQASPEATIRRLVEVSERSIVAVFFAWKLKPSQKRTIGRNDQPGLFGSPEDERRALSKLRVEYSIPSPSFEQSGIYIPVDKSIDNTGIIFEAATNNACRDGECEIDLGPCNGYFRVSAVPLFTLEDGVGPSGERNVAAILEPAVRKARNSRR